MKVFWLVSMTLPAAAAACGLPGQSDVSGGWLSGQLGALKGSVSLTVCSVSGKVQALTSGTLDGVDYLLLPAADEDAFTALLRQQKPDLVHLWGTEYPAAAVLHRAANALGIPALVGIQGVMEHIAAHVCDGVPPQYGSSCAAQRIIDRVVPGHLLDKLQADFDRAAAAEAALLAEARFVTGRTDFDREFTAKAAPKARYFFCNETLRPEFYADSPLWQRRDFGTAPVLFLSAGNYPLKNLHTVLRALPSVLQRWPNAVLRIAGWPPLDKGPLLRPVIRWMFPYETYCHRLMTQLGVADRVEYTGPLNASAMRQAFLGADVFLLPSFSENSPNSLGEAMLLGVPAVVSRAGGIPSTAAFGIEALCYGEPADHTALAETVIGLLAAPEKAAALSAAARRRALADHDPAANGKTMLEIYRTIAAEGVQHG